MTKIMALVSSVVLAMVAAHGTSAHASPIGGVLDLSGTFQPTKNGAATQNMAQSNGIDFLLGSSGFGSFTASNGTGNLALFSGHTGTIKDFVFAPTFGPITNFYSMTVGSETLSFDLSSISISVKSANHFDLSGIGTLHLTGFADTSATFDFDGESSNGASPNAKFSWSAVIDPPIIQSDAPELTAVSEPSVFALLGASLIGLAALRRRKPA